MKNSFFGYYHPREEELHELWETCLFVLDANVLLNLYRYSPGTSASLINILTEISNRLWIPHQVALEYQTNRLDEIARQAEIYAKVLCT